MKRIPVSKGKYFALIDDEDLPLISKYEWRALVQKHRIYARYCSKNGKHITTIRMHRVITSAKNGVIVDHINGNGLDNRRANLRFCVNSENSRNRRRPENNSSGYKGVHYRCDRKRHWVAKIGYGGRNIHIGCFFTAEEAATAYNEKARELFGEFARPNVVETA